jgi:hypothetical protein
MSRFNAKGDNESKVDINDIVLNEEGAISFVRNFKEELVNIISSAMISGKGNFYESDSERMNRIESFFNKTLYSQEMVEFLAKAIVYSRNVANLRSLPVFLSVLLAEKVRNEPIVRKAIRNFVARPDDMTELVALWDARNPKDVKLSKNVPSSIRRGLKDILESGKFNEFGYRRYFGNKNKVKMSDIVKIARPCPKSKEEEVLFKKIIENKLPKVETVEVMKADGIDSKTVILDLLGKKKLGYMAAIKNICNFIAENPTDDELNIFLTYLENENAIKNSKVFPFRILDAWKEIKQLNISEFRTKRIKNTLDKILTVTLSELKFFDDNEKVAIILDESGSMNTSSFNASLFEIGLVLSSMIMLKSNKDNTLFYTFSNDCKLRDNSFSSIIDFIETNRKDFASGGTYVSKVFERLLDSETKVNKILIFTDEQLYPEYGSFKCLTSYYNKYKKINPNVQVLFWNLNSYRGGTPISLKENNILEINGFSSNILEYVSNVFRDKNFIIKEIEKIELR